MMGSKMRERTNWQGMTTRLTECFVYNVDLICDKCTRAEHGFDLVDELLSHQVGESPHVLHPVFLLAGNALQGLAVLGGVEHVSDTDGTHVNGGIPARTHPQKKIQKMRQEVVLLPVT